MKFFRWLFGSTNSLQAQLGEPEWERLENGGSTRIYKEREIRVSKFGDGWRYWISVIDGKPNSFFSGAYSTEVAARYEALAEIDGLPIMHSMSSKWFSINRKSELESLITQKSQYLRELTARLAMAENLRDLKHIRYKLGRQLKQASLCAPEYRRLRLDSCVIAEAERTTEAFKAMATQVDTRISEIKSVGAT